MNDLSKPMKLKIHSIKTTPAVLVAGLLLVTSAAFADAPLKSALGLDLDQAAKADVIQKEARDAVRPVREVRAGVAIVSASRAGFSRGRCSRGCRSR